LDHDEVKVTNIFMGNLQRPLVVMLGDNGCDVGLLKDANGFPVDKQEFVFSPTDKMILRQYYECGSELVVLVSKFFQLNVSTSHLACTCSPLSQDCTAA
jgi:hypothetical protein